MPNYRKPTDVRVESVAIHILPVSIRRRIRFVGQLHPRVRHRPGFARKDGGWLG